MLLGAILAAVDVLTRQLTSATWLPCVGCVVLLLILTGGLHADGLIDTCDAIFGHASPERRLEIMRDPHVGAFGVVGFVCIAALKIASLDALPPTLRPVLLLLAPGLGRWCIVLSATVYPYGRPGGSGEPIKAGATPRALVLASVLPLAACVLAGPVGLLCGVLVALGTLAFGRWLVRLLPGLTGDCYGAICEVAETIVWLSAALAWPRLTT